MSRELRSEQQANHLLVFALLDVERANVGHWLRGLHSTIELRLQQSLHMPHHLGRAEDLASARVPTGSGPAFTLHD